MCLTASRTAGLWLLLWMLALVPRESPGADTAPHYARFAKGEWKGAFQGETALSQARRVTLKDGILTADDGFARDRSAGAVSMKDGIVRAKVRGRGGLFLRGEGEFYTAWLGEDAIGVNKYVGGKVVVLAMRPVKLELGAFHELALAAVGDRVLVFYDGRRLLDVVDRDVKEGSAVAIHSHQTKAEFQDVEVLSLDGVDVARLLPERDPLAKLAGTWDVERTLTVPGQPPRKSTGVMHMERGLANFYFVRSTATDGSSSLFVQEFLPEESATRAWTFFSSGQMDQYDKKYDPDAEQETIPARPVRNGTTSGVIRRTGPGTSETRFKTIGPDGQLVAEFLSVNKQRNTAGEPPSLRAAGPAPEPAEVAVLAPYVGRWSMEVEIRPTKFDSTKRMETLIDETQWILGGKFLQRIERKPSGEIVSVQIGGYDPATKELKFVMFQNSGNTARWTMTFDEASQSFVSKITDLPPGWAGSARDRLLDADTRETVGALKNAAGETIWDATIVRRRQK